METMIASETVLKRDWDTPEEDAAWGQICKRGCRCGAFPFLSKLSRR